jgi:hypothetical protein
MLFTKSTENKYDSISLILFLSFTSDISGLLLGQYQAFRISTFITTNFLQNSPLSQNLSKLFNVDSIISDMGTIPHLLPVEKITLSNPSHLRNISDLR